MISLDAAPLESSHPSTPTPPPPSAEASGTEEGCPPGVLPFVFGVVRHAAHSDEIERPSSPFPPSATVSKTCVAVTAASALTAHWRERGRGKVEHVLMFHRLLFF